mmetsp:Transcript_4685/g.14456  ORF Transcript_4685/g.14456 Transcript_4685/m.14456 type:complete len:289 (+) Transcript_4685:61-927(+)
MQLILSFNQAAGKHRACCREASSAARSAAASRHDSPSRRTPSTTRAQPERRPSWRRGWAHATPCWERLESIVHAGCTGPPKETPRESIHTAHTCPRAFAPRTRRPPPSDAMRGSDNALAPPEGGGGVWASRDARSGRLRLARARATAERRERRALREHARVVVRQHLDKLADARLPVAEQLLGAHRARLRGVRLDVAAQLGHVRLRVGDRRERDHLHVAPAVEGALLVKHVRDASRHARRKVVARAAEHNTSATRHVLAAVVTNALDYRHRARVAHAEALARAPAEEG